MKSLEDKTCGPPLQITNEGWTRVQMPTKGNDYTIEKF